MKIRDINENDQFSLYQVNFISKQVLSRHKENRIHIFGAGAAVSSFWRNCRGLCAHKMHPIQYIPRNMHTVFALLCLVVVIHWLIFPYPSGLLHWHCGNLTIAPVPAKQPWWIWINTSCEFIMNDCITTTKQSTTKPCAYFLGYTVPRPLICDLSLIYIMLESTQCCMKCLLILDLVITALDSISIKLCSNKK